MAQENPPVLQSSYRGVSIEIIESPDIKQITIVSHKPFSKSLTCSVPRELIAQLIDTNTLGPFLMSASAMMHLMVNMDLVDT